MAGRCFQMPFVVRLLIGILPGAHNRAALSSTGPATFAALKQIVVKWKEYCNAEEKGRLEAATDSIDASDPKEVAASAKEVRAILVTAWKVRQHLVGLMRGVYKTTRKSFGGSGMSENDFKQLQDLEDTMKEWTEDMHALREAGKEGDEEGQ